jgi:hypothetical protein
MRVIRLVWLALGVAALAACDNTGSNIAGGMGAQKESVVLTAIENYALPLPIAAMQAAPATSPFRSRILIRLDDGSLHALNLAVGEIKAIDALTVDAFGYAGAFQLRGVAAPLLIAAGDRVQLHLFDAETGSTMQIPATTVRPMRGANAICILDDTPAKAEFAVIGAGSVTAYEVRDVGEELLQLSETTPAAVSPQSRSCIEQALGAQIELGTSGIVVTQNKTTIARDLNGATVASVGFTAVDNEIITLAALPAKGQILARSDRPNTADVHFKVQGGVNSVAIEVPTAMAISAANFGGSYNSGVAVLAENNQIAIISLDAISDAIISIDPLKEGSWSEIEKSRGN